jgi:glycosyltransferase involved in cell wall biosynthesis
VRIGVNATCLNDRPSGARQRFIGLFEHLVPLMPDSRFVFFEPRDCEVARFLDAFPNVERVSTPLCSEGRWRRAWQGSLYWSRTLQYEKFDIFEALHLPLIRPRRSRVILTIHDLRGLQEGSGHSAWLYRHVLARALAGSDLIVTVSEAMRSEIMNFRPGVRVAVVPNGLDDDRPSVAGDCGPTLERLGLPRQFLLAVGHLEPRKNYPALVDAVHLLSASGIQLPLVIVGNDSGAGEQIRSRIAEHGLQSRVLMLSGLSDAELSLLYRVAEAFVFPSRYEGFGIPLLEAMQAGTPVVASDIPVFREVLADAGAWFDPGSAASIASVIAEVLGDESRKERMRNAGRKRARAYRYEALATRMRDHYLELGGNHGDPRSQARARRCVD